MVLMLVVQHSCCLCMPVSQWHRPLPLPFQHAQLSGYQSGKLPMVVAQALAALKRRRPQLRVTTQGSDYDPGGACFVDTAAAFCS